VESACATFCSLIFWSPFLISLDPLDA
jgi:hypothetical protein